MIWRWLMTITVGLMAGFWEVSVTPFMPSELAWYPLLPIAVLLLVSSKRARAFAALAAGGMILDAYRWAQIDVATLRLVLVLLILDAVSNRLLTNRSVYASVVLVWIGRLIDWVGAYLLSLIGTWIDPTKYPWHLPVDAWWVLILDAGSVALGFLLIAGFTRRFVTLGKRESLF